MKSLNCLLIWTKTNFLINKCVFEWHIKWIHIVAQWLLSHTFNDICFNTESLGIGMNVHLLSIVYDCFQHFYFFYFCAFIPLFKINIRYDTYTSQLNLFFVCCYKNDLFSWHYEKMEQEHCIKKSFQYLFENI